MDEKSALDAETDQALAWFRDHRNDRLGAGPNGDFYREMSTAFAAMFAEQFPGIPVGRVVMAVAQALKAINVAFEEQRGEPVSVNTLLSIAGLAAEQLDREANR